MELIYSNISVRQQLLPPSQLLFAFGDCSCHRTAVLSASTEVQCCTPLCPSVQQKADCWPVFARTDESDSSTTFCSLRRGIQFCFSSFLRQVFWNYRKLFIFESLTSTSDMVTFVRCSYLHCTHVNRDRTISFSNISYKSHTAWVSPTARIFWKLFSLQTSGLETSEETHKDHRLQVQSASNLQSWGIQHLQTPRALLNTNKSDTMEHCTEFSCMFLSCSFNLIIFPRHGKIAMYW